MAFGSTPVYYFVMKKKTMTSLELPLLDRSDHGWPLTLSLLQIRKERTYKQESDCRTFQLDKNNPNPTPSTLLHHRVFLCGPGERRNETGHSANLVVLNLSFPLSSCLFLLSFVCEVSTAAFFFFLGERKTSAAL